MAGEYELVEMHDLNPEPHVEQFMDPRDVVTSCDIDKVS